MSPSPQPIAAAQHRPRAVGGGGGRAQIAFARDAPLAAPAGGKKGKDDAVADLKLAVGEPAASTVDRGFVAERHRQRAPPVAVDHRQVGMTHARRVDPDQQFTRARGGEVERGRRSGRLAA